MCESKLEGFLSIFKGVFLSLITALIGVLVFALVVKLASLPSSVIKPVNCFIKILAIFIGCLFSLRGNKGFLKGALVGLVGTLVIFSVFALIGGELAFGLPFLIDLVFGLVIGCVSGIVTVNIRK